METVYRRMMNWKGFGRSWLEVPSHHFPEELRNATKNVRISDISAEIQTEYLPKRNPKQFV
jgi:hypothetical protein